MPDTAAASRPNAKLAAALALADYGFSVFPLIPNDKRPLIENWQNLATNDKSRVKEWWHQSPDANIGITTGDLLVIDVDPRNGGNETFKNLVENGGLLGEEFPTTLAAATQGGGTHMFYWLPPGTTARGGANKLGPGVDIKAFGGYVVGAGSTIDGRPYAWKPTYAPEKHEFIQAPEWLVTRCNTARTKTADAGKVIVLEDEIAIRACRQWLEASAPQASIGERGYTAFKVACRFYDYGVSKETCVELLQDWSEEFCEAPMDAADIEHAAYSALKNRDNAVGAKHPGAPGFDEVEIAPRAEMAAATPTSPEGGPFFSPAARFNAADIPERPWIVPGFACRGRVTMLAGPGGVAKSTYALMMAVAIVAQRDDICGYAVPKREKVAVWNQEDDLEEMQRRLAAIMTAFNVSWADIEGPNGEPMLYLNSGVEHPLMLAVRTAEGSIRASKQVAAAIADIKAQRIGLIVLDPLVELHEAVENDNVQMRGVVALVRDIAVKGDCAVLLAAHTKKPPAASSDGFAGEMDAARGASSQFGVIRVGATLFSASPKDAKKWSMPGSHLDYVRLDIAKNNLARRTGEPLWFKRDGIVVGASVDRPGENIGILRPVTLAAVEKEASNHFGELIAEAIAQAHPRGVWLKAGPVVEAACALGGIKFDAKNLARTIKSTFDGAEEIPTEFGKLKCVVKDKTPTMLWLEILPHLPQNDVEEELID
jgi:hypothetical protein